MNKQARRARVWVAAIALLLASPAAGAAAQPPWLEAQSAHFTVTSDASADEIRQAARDFERIRAVLAGTLRGARVDPDQPLVILAVRNGRGLRELLPQYWERRGAHPVAAFWAGPYRRCIALRLDTPAPERMRRALHEYVHLVTHANVPDPPAWLDEGLSELWATAVVGDGTVEVGRPPVGALKLLRQSRSWIPLRDLMAMGRAPEASDKNKLRMFYAQSWALAHYLVLGRNGGAGLSAGLYADDPRTIDDAGALERELKTYVDSARIETVRFEWQPPDPAAESADLAEVPVRRLSAADALVARAGCLADGERPDAALPLLNEALTAEPDHAPALETLGYIRFQQNQAREAASWFDRAIATGSASHLAYFYRAILAGPVPQAPGGVSIETQQYLRRSIELNADFAPAYERLSVLVSKEDANSVEAVSLLRRAIELDPNNS
jgi:tetratricopeptide (TPR) repeat protein